MTLRAARQELRHRPRRLRRRPSTAACRQLPRRPELRRRRHAPTSAASASARRPPAPRRTRTAASSPTAAATTFDCGDCTTPQTCGGGGVANVCGCTPTTCAALGQSCGPASDGCGGTLDCGACPWPTSCGGGSDAALVRLHADHLRGAGQGLRPDPRRLQPRHELRQRAAAATRSASPTCAPRRARARRKPPAIRGSACSSPTAVTACSTAAAARRGSAASITFASSAAADYSPRAMTSPRLPPGVRDYLPVAAARRRGLAATAAAEIERWGYRGIITPAFEYDACWRAGWARRRRRDALRRAGLGRGGGAAARHHAAGGAPGGHALADEPGPIRLSYEGIGGAHAASGAAARAVPGGRRADRRAVSRAATWR